MAKFYSEKEIQFIINNYNKLGTKNCAKIFNVSVENFRARLNRLNIKAIGNPFPELSNDQIENIRKEISPKKLNVDFNTNENKKELAYFLGYFWADGYINKNNCLIIEIMQDDGEQILPIFQKLADFNIYYRTRTNRKPQMTFYTSSKEVCDLFKSLGKYPNSVESHDKILKYVPKEYHQWFLRGFVDGDGCFYLNKNNNCTQFSICGSENQNWTDMLQLCIDFGLTNAKICKRSQVSGNSSIIRSTSKHTIISFINNLYYDKDNIWLNRKFIKALEIKMELSKACKQLIITDPFYGLFLLSLSKCYSDNVPTAGICRNGIDCQLEVNKDFWYSLTDEQQLAILKHELKHGLLM